MPLHTVGVNCGKDGSVEWALTYAYLADKVHNPTRQITWTPPYYAYWASSNVVTGIRSVDIRGVFFSHFGADIASKHIAFSA